MYIVINKKKFKVYEKNGSFFYYTRTKQRHDLQEDSDIQEDPPKPVKIKTDLKKIMEEDARLRQNIEDLHDMLNNSSSTSEDLHRRLQECEELRERMETDMLNANVTSLERIVRVWIQENIIEDLTLEDFNRQFNSLNVKQKNEFLLSIIDNNINNVVQLRKRLTDTIQDLREKDNEIEKIVARAQIKLAEFEQENGRLVEAVRELTRLNRGLSEDVLNMRRTIEERQSKHNEDLERVMRELRECNEKVAAFETRNAEMTQQVQNLRARIDDFEQQMARDENQFDEYQQQITNLNETISGLRTSCGNDKNLIRELDECKARLLQRENELRDQLDNNNRLTTEIENLTTTLDGKNKELAGINQRLDSLEQMVRESTSELERETAKLVKAEQDLEDMRRLIDSLPTGEDRDRLQSEMEQYQTKLKEKDDLLRQQGAEIDRQNLEIRDLTQQRDSLKSERDTCNDDLHQFRTRNLILTQQKDNLQQDVTLLGDKLALCENQNQTYISDIQRLRDELTRKEQEKENLNLDLENKKKELKALKDTLDEKEMRLAQLYEASSAMQQMIGNTNQGDLEEEISNLRQEIESLREEIDSLKSELKKSKSESNALKSQLEKLGKINKNHLQESSDLKLEVVKMESKYINTLKSEKECRSELLVRRETENALREELEHYRKDKEDERNRLLDEIDTKSQELESLKSQILALERDSKSRDTGLKQQIQRVLEAEKALEEMRNMLPSQREEDRREIQEYADRIKEKEALLKAESEKLEVQRLEINKLKEQRDDAKSEKDALNARLNVCDASLEECNSELRELKSRSIDRDGKYLELQREIDLLKVENEILRTKTPSSKDCSELERKLKQTQDALSDKEEELLKTYLGASPSEEDCSELKQEIDDLRIEHSNRVYELKESLKADCDKEVRKVRAELDETTRQLVLLGEVYEKLMNQTEKEKESADKYSDSKSQYIEKIQLENTKLDRQLDALKAANKRLNLRIIELENDKTSIKGASLKDCSSLEREIVRLKEQLEKSEERYTQTYEQASQYLTELQIEKDRNQRLQSELEETKDYGFPLEEEGENLTQSGVLRQKLENAPRKGQFDPARDFISIRGRTPTDSDTFEPARTFTSSSDKTVERKARKLPFQFRFF